MFDKMQMKHLKDLRVKDMIALVPKTEELADIKEYYDLNVGKPFVIGKVTVVNNDPTTRMVTPQGKPYTLRYQPWVMVYSPTKQGIRYLAYPQYVYGPELKLQKQYETKPYFLSEAGDLVLREREKLKRQGKSYKEIEKVLGHSLLNVWYDPDLSPLKVVGKIPYKKNKGNIIIQPTMLKKILPLLKGSLSEGFLSRALNGEAPPASDDGLSSTERPSTALVCVEKNDSDSDEEGGSGSEEGGIEGPDERLNEEANVDEKDDVYNLPEAPRPKPKAINANEVYNKTGFELSLVPVGSSSVSSSASSSAFSSKDEKKNFIRTLPPRLQFFRSGARQVDPADVEEISKEESKGCALLPKVFNKDGHIGLVALSSGDYEIDPIVESDEEAVEEPSSKNRVDTRKEGVKVVSKRPKDSEESSEEKKTRRRRR